MRIQRKQIIAYGLVYIARIQIPEVWQYKDKSNIDNILLL